MPPVFWVQKQDIGPSPRVSHGMAYLPANQRVVVFGGDPGGPPLADTWAWDGNLWTQVADTGPSARHSVSLSDHAGAGGAAQRLVLFGGASGANLFGDTWTFDGDDWTQVADTGPSARAGHATAFDPVRQRLVLFGGDDGSRLGDTWVWDGTNWTQVADTGPSARRGHAMAFDEARGRVILFGGAHPNGNGLDDTWAWDGTTWTQIADTGPSQRVGAGLAGIGSLLLFGGVNTIDLGPNAGNREVHGDTWQLTAQGWSKVQDIGPAARWGHGAVAMKVGAAPGRIVVFGGGTAFAANEDAALVPGLRSDTWEVPDSAAGGGSQPPPPPPPPPLQITAVMVQPSTAPAFGNFVQFSVTIVTNVPPPAGTSPLLMVVRGPAPNWIPQQPPGFSLPVVTFDGVKMGATFVINRDPIFIGTGQFGIQVQIGPTAKAVGAFSLQ